MKIKIFSFVTYGAEKEIKTFEAEINRWLSENEIRVISVLQTQNNRLVIVSICYAKWASFSK